MITSLILLTSCTPRYYLTDNVNNFVVCKSNLILLMKFIKISTLHKSLLKCMF